MNDYPAYSLDHNVPLLITIGLPPPAGEKDDGDEWSLGPELKEQATLLRSELPLLTGESAVAFREYLTTDDTLVAPWKGRSSPSRYRFRIRTAGRTYYLPPRRSRLPENFEAGPGPVTLHSPFSPLSPSCSLYADGIIDARWIQKHQELVPSVFLCCYALTSDAATATLQDGKIRADISAFRAAVQQSGYKSRVAVAIFADEVPGTSSLAAEGVQERLEAIRRGSGMEAKLFFVVSSVASTEERSRMAENMLTMIAVPAMEYYRDLGRHARKKRGRSSAPQPSVPPTSGTSQTLSLPGWHIRYDFKTAVLAEFRHELDVALRALDAAYTALLGPDMLEAIPNWSPRWNEARLLADIIAVRCLRCLLLGGYSTAAVRRWEAHRIRMRSLVDTHGRGSANYGFAAWEARWALVMAGLVENNSTTGKPLAGLDPRTGALFLPPEKTVATERLPPWNNLHHSGYWYRLAAGHLRRRRSLAHAIPEDDRRPPDASPASKVASRAFTYDDYMCPPPNDEYPLVGFGGRILSSNSVNHAAMIIECLEAARAAFLQRQQTRQAAEIALECAQEYSAIENWLALLNLLAPLWAAAVYRAEGWFDINEELAWTLRKAATALGRVDLLVSIQWELLDSRYTPRKDAVYDVSQALGGSKETTKVSVELADQAPPSFLSATFVFRTGEGKAGHALPAQLSIRSNALAGSVPIVFDSVLVHFEGGSTKPVVLRHSTDPPATSNKRATVFYSAVSLEESGGNDGGNGKDDYGQATDLHGTADLILHPQSTAVYEVVVPLREAGDVRAVAAELHYDCKQYKLRQMMSVASGGAGQLWFLSPFVHVPVSRTDSQAVHVQPRPPKMDIRLLEGEDGKYGATEGLQFYTNEPIEVVFAIRNDEDADANVKLDVVLFGGDDGAVPGFTLWVEDMEAGRAVLPDDDDDEADEADEVVLRGIPVGAVSKAGGTVRASLHLLPVAVATSFDLTVRAVYHLIDDPATPITQTLAVPLSLSNPFEANYDLLPRRHPDAWPSLFDHEGILPVAADETDESSVINTTHPHGLAQTWTLVAHYVSFAAQDLRVVDLDVIVQPVPGIACRSTRRGQVGVCGGHVVQPQTVQDVQFDLVVQKASLEHRDLASLDASLVVRWQRLGNDSVNVTTLPVPRLGIFGTEPRVLASVVPAHEKALGLAAGLLTLAITIENATGHFLTFGLTMEPSGEFAFSGAKLTTMHVLPMSRRTQIYHLLPLVRNAWIHLPLVVRDKYFQKVLRILPTEGLKMGKEGILVWVEGDKEARTDEK